MKRTFFAALAAGPLLLAGTLIASAAASPSSQVYHNETATFADVNPCTSVPGTSTTTATDVFHLTARPDGTVSVAGTRTGTITFTPSDPSQPIYTGHFSQSYAASGDISPTTGAVVVGEETSAYTVRASALDGSVIAYQEVSHETVNPDGTLTVSFDRPSAHCG